MEYSSDEGEGDHGGKNEIKFQPWLRKIQPVNKPIKISVIKSTINVPTQGTDRKCMTMARAGPDKKRTDRTNN